MPKKTEEALKKDLHRLVEIHADRLTLSQDLGWLFRPLAVCPFPAASLGKRQVTGRGRACWRWSQSWASSWPQAGQGKRLPQRRVSL